MRMPEKNADSSSAETTQEAPEKPVIRVEDILRMHRLMSEIHAALFGDRTKDIGKGEG